MAEKHTFKLSSQSIARLLRSDQWNEIWDPELKGFHIRKTSGTASYRLSYRDPKTQKRRILTLGRADQVPFNEAKEAASYAVSQIAIMNMRSKIKRALSPQDNQAA
jgi:hypothetical protein